MITIVNIIIVVFVLAIITGCFPSCGPNAFCQDSDGRPVCACNPGYQGNGYNCEGLLKSPQRHNSRPMRNRRQWLRKMFFEGARIKKVLCGLCENGWIHVWSAHVSPLLRYDYNKFIVPFADVDECEDGENRCNVNALCSNTLGSYVCRCIRGFEGDGVTCVGRSLRYANLKLAPKRSSFYSPQSHTRRAKM